MERKKVSSCCRAEIIPPMSEGEMEDNYIGSNWIAASCYICKRCGKACEAVKHNLGLVDMKPEQLRKGNLLKNQMDGSLIIVKAYDIYCLEEGMDSFIMQPIPLTEEWICKSGFNSGFSSDPQEPNASKVHRIKGIEIHQIEEREQHFEVFLNSTKEDYHIVLKYVHQLQNLYFALTGEELTVKV